MIISEVVDSSKLLKSTLMMIEIFEVEKFKLRTVEEKELVNIKLQVVVKNSANKMNRYQLYLFKNFA
ncbi:hypothetical protein CQJ30_08780 [Caldibacillus thermoamylovorans]|nr:hypothetical protein CQJ30_08780 [Caldibacillus thermoamylovorans]